MANHSGQVDSGQVDLERPGRFGSGLSLMGLFSLRDMGRSFQCS